jgi:hypothetical protein
MIPTYELYQDEVDGELKLCLEIKIRSSNLLFIKYCII